MVCVEYLFVKCIKYRIKITIMLEKIKNENIHKVTMGKLTRIAVQAVLVLFPMMRVKLHFYLYNFQLLRVRIL